VGLFALFSGVLPVIMTGFDEYKIIWKTPVAGLLVSLLDTVLTVVFSLFLIRLFTSSVEKNLRESL
jgi:hypothetical protein